MNYYKKASVWNNKKNSKKWKKNSKENNKY